ncbi:MAG TPA: L,D-transpeptidase [Aestuariivirga sp.]|nr:L,D-transpeptidase [Aestuariivirga sp.]
MLLPMLGLALLLLGAATIPAQASPSNDPALRHYAPGSVIIKTKMRQLIYVRGKNDFVTYKIAVGREGRKWTGKTKISRKVLDPAWAPPAAVRRDNPNLPAVVQPGPRNPLGVAVLVLGSGRYGIHGTNRPETIGTDASYGCFRMRNADILALFRQVEIGTVVYVKR